MGRNTTDRRPGPLDDLYGAPRWQHDQDCCTFLGRHGDADLYGSDKTFLARLHKDGVIYMARYSDEGSDYTCNDPEDPRHPEYEAKRRWDVIHSDVYLQLQHVYLEVAGLLLGTRRYLCEALALIPDKDGIHETPADVARRLFPDEVDKLYPKD